MTTTALLRRLSAVYMRDRRTSGGLRARLVGLAHEVSRHSGGVASPGDGRRPAEVERVREELERSSRAADDRLRAMESIIAAAVRRTGDPPVESSRAGPVADVPHRPVAEPVRGGWSQPISG